MHKSRHMKGASPREDFECTCPTARGSVGRQCVDLVSGHHASRISRDGIRRSLPLGLLFRDSMMVDIEGWVIRRERYSYTRCGRAISIKPKSGLRNWCTERKIESQVRHTSRHADPKTLARFAQALLPRLVIPIHTTAPHMFRKLIANTVILNDGVCFGL
jgi:ribonuclease J